MPGTNTMENIRIESTNMNMDSNQGWVTPEPSAKSRNQNTETEDCNGYNEHSSKTSRKSHSIPIVQVASNIHFIDPKNEQDPDFHKHNRGRALSTPEISQHKHDSLYVMSNIESDSPSPRKKSSLSEDNHRDSNRSSHEKHRQKRNSRTLSQPLLNSKSSPNFQDMLKQSNNAVDRLVSVEEQDNESSLLNGVRYSNLPPMWENKRSHLRKTKSSLNLNTQPLHQHQSRTSTPGEMRRSTLLFDLEQISPFGSRANTPRLSSRQSTRSRILDPIPHKPTVLNNNGEEISDRISPPLYSSGVPVSMGHPGTPQLEPLRHRTSTPQIIIEDEGLLQFMPKRRQSLDPIASTCKRPPSRNGLMPEMDESISENMVDQDQDIERENAEIFGPAKADILLNLRYSPSGTSPPAYTFSSKPQNNYVGLHDHDQLKTSKTMKKRRPGTGLISPALRAETAFSQHKIQKTTIQKDTDVSDANGIQDTEVKRLTNHMEMSHRNNNSNCNNKSICGSSTEPIKEEMQKTISNSNIVDECAISQSHKGYSIDIKQPISFVSLEELEAASPIFAESITRDDESQKVNTGEVEISTNVFSNGNSNNMEYLTNKDEGTFSLQVSDKISSVDKQINPFERQTSVKLVVSEQDSAVSITLTPPEEHISQVEVKQSNSVAKKTSLSSRAAEATNRLYEPPKKVLSKVSNILNKNQMRPGRSKSKSQILSNDRDRSMSSDKSKTQQKAKPKKVTNTMGSRPSNLKPKKARSTIPDKSKQKPTASKQAEQKSNGNKNENERSARIAKGLEYEKRTEKTLRRIEERLNSPAVKSKRDNDHSSQRSTMASTPVIVEAYPKCDEDEENLLDKVRVTVPNVSYPRRIKSASARKPKTQSANKKRRDCKTPTGDNEICVTNPQNSDKIVRATSAGLVIEKGLRQSGRPKKGRKGKYIPEFEPENELPADFDPLKHAILSGPDWHVVAAKNYENKSEMGTELVLEENHGAGDTSSTINDKLTLFTQGEISNENYTAPLSPIQEVCSSGQSSLRTNSSTLFRNDENTTNIDKSRREISNTDQIASEKSIEDKLKDTLHINAIDIENPTQNKNLQDDINPFTKKADESNNVKLITNAMVRNCSSPNEYGIEEIPLPDNPSIKHSPSNQIDCFKDIETKNLLDDPQFIAIKNVDGSDVIIKDEKLVFSFSHSGEKSKQSLGDTDEVFLPVVESADTDSILNESRSPSDDKGERNNESEEDNDETDEDELDVAAKLQKIMRSMRQRSELDAHTLMNYRKSNDENDYEENSDASSENDTDIGTLTEKELETKYWKEYYKTPVLEPGVLSLLFGEDNSQSQSVTDQISRDSVPLKKVNFPNQVEDFLGKSEGFKLDSSTIDHYSKNENFKSSDGNEEMPENYDFVPFERFPSCVTNSSENTLIGDIPFQNIDEKHDMNANEIFQSVDDMDNFSSLQNNDSDDEEIMLELEKTLQAPSDSENTVEDNENKFDDEDSRPNSAGSFKGLKLTQQTLRQHNKEQEKVSEQEENNQSSSMYHIQKYKVSDRLNMQSRASAFTKTTEYSQNSDSTMKAELDTAACLGWRKGKELGHGSYGTVYEGLTRDGQLIAVKQVELPVHDRQTAEKEFKQIQLEVDLLRALRHENIVSLLGTSLEGNMVLIFMEHIAGGSISSILQQYGPLKERIFRKYTKQILNGVEYLHESSVVHRDIKGSNVMLMTSGIIKLIDFGCAKRLKENSFKRESENSDDGRLLKSLRGTPYWMAPEVITSEGHGPKSDIWSIGCTVFEMATKKPPLRDKEPYQAMYYIGDGNKMPELPRPQFSRSAVDFVRKCLIRKPDDRPTANELLNHRFILHKKKRKPDKKEDVD
uniref:uncharacterized protein LOC120336531 n=1 Tax=Styela clava TaxID=7725 RepID=UPI00193AC618|nr:uncharacterized protein LOC120336531 [Styela clava]